MKQRGIPDEKALIRPQQQLSHPVLAGSVGVAPDRPPAMSALLPALRVNSIEAPVPKWQSPTGCD